MENHIKSSFRSRFASAICHYAIIATQNTPGGENIMLNPAAGMGIDVFTLDPSA
jgi:hypothetical protein